MDYMNLPQGTPQFEQNQGNPGQQSQPQPDGYYQFQPGLGFVQVQVPQGDPGQPVGGQTQQPLGEAAQQAAYQAAQAQQAAQAEQAGMFGQGTPEGAQPKFDQQRLGKMYSTVSDVMNGEADPSSLIGLFAENSGDFWKGALVGAAAAVLLNNDAVKGALGGLVGSVGAMFGDKDPDGEQVTVGGE